MKKLYITPVVDNMGIYSLQLFMDKASFYEGGGGSGGGAVAKERDEFEINEEDFEEQEAMYLLSEHTNKNNDLW